MIALETASSPTNPGRHVHRIGQDFTAPATVGHRITDSGVTLVLPHGRDLTDAEARRLAWGLLSDLEPDEVAPIPEVVNYAEACRLAVIEAMRAGPATIDQLAQRVGWKRRRTERRIHELLQDGRAERVKISPHDVRFRLTARRYIETERAA